MDLSRFTEEQIAKAQACGSAEEIMLLVSDEGVVLTDDELNQVSGGWKDEPKTKYVCKCGGGVSYEGPQKRYVCKSCGNKGMYPCDMKTVPL
ncbi:MAG: bacteriocin [Eggerthellaceae bacterium]|nr:bacteriocin [Eggerthellaceae bacterium]